jgi:2,4-dienoyl-CoA reductase-like NADH-dependent reductase (Old Yellow Enzyme family)
LKRIVVAIREVVPKEFAVGIKINAADYTSGASEDDDTRIRDHTRLIASWGLVDFIEVSGGDYEDPG